jgi:energy-coupling factor transporter ATP-binding protein EcfA2
MATLESTAAETLVEAPAPVGRRPAVEVAHLRKTYGTLVAVDDVSITVTEGEIFGILGPNGAGKTTAIECAIGLRRPDAGTNGHAAERGPPRPRSSLLGRGVFASVRLPTPGRPGRPGRAARRGYRPGPDGCG